MKTNRYLYTMIVFALLSFSTATQAAEQTKIDQVVKQVNDIKFIKGQFTQLKKLQGVAYPLKAQGHFMFWKGQGFYLATEKPFFNAMTITGASMINWQADGTGTLAQEQIGIIQREVNKTLLAFFSADLELIQQRFSADWVFDKDNWQLTLTPKLDVIQKNMRSAVIQGNNYVQGLTVTAGNGDETTIEFNEQQERAEPSAAECRWFYLQEQDACSKFH
jgi:outer membrane lipoprotein-sorting protein